MREKCICIKDGYMLNGGQICVCGEVYNYVEDGYGYSVDSMILRYNYLRKIFTNVCLCGIM